MFKNHTKLVNVIVVVGSVVMTYLISSGSYYEGARAGATYVIEQNYLMDTDMRKFMEESKNCDLVDKFTDQIEDNLCSPKDDPARKKLHYGMQTPWGYITTSRPHAGVYD